MNRSGEQRSRYQVYVLRMWRESASSADSVDSAESAESAGSAKQTALWRFVLEEPKTGQRRGFANFAALMAFLEWELQGQEAIGN